MFGMTNLKNLIDEIQDDVTQFVQTELQIYLSDSKVEGLDRSVVANIALFDLTGINSEKGFLQINRLLGSHYDQMVERRTRQLLHSLYIRYGADKIDKVKKRVVETFTLAYPTIRPENIAHLNRTHNTFWLVPFIKEAYNTLVMGAKK